MSTDTPQAQIKTAMATLAHVDLADVTVVYVDGTATVAGSVARTFDRDEIAAALRRLPGVVTVLDQLQVRT
jgi:osmotically-inducible protein OsmY